MPPFHLHAGPPLKRETCLAELLLSCDLKEWFEIATRQWQNPGHGDFSRWQAIAQAMPSRQARHVNLNANRPEIGAPEELSARQRETLTSGLRALSPWRKGPFSTFGICIDAEWQSFMKLNRVLPHVSGFQGRRVLDVGSGNGYYLLRMVGMGARLALGVEPHWLANWQFSALTRFLSPELPAWIVPARLEDLPPGPFDTVLSMGVLHHHRKPEEHLERLREYLLPGGELVLETLVNEEAPSSGVLHIDGRYANMRNVWMLLHPDHVLELMDKAGFRSPRHVNCSLTSCEEQRTTDWMSLHSLREALDPNDPTRTVEGYPAPNRAVFVSTA